MANSFLTFLFFDDRKRIQKRGEPKYIKKKKKRKSCVRQKKSAKLKTTGLHCLFLRVRRFGGGSLQVLKEQFGRGRKERTKERRQLLEGGGEQFVSFQIVSTVYTIVVSSLFSLRVNGYFFFGVDFFVCFRCLKKNFNETMSVKVVFKR